MNGKSAGRDRAIFRQVCELIPSHLIPKLARKHGIETMAITPWSHVVSLLYAKFSHAIGLNDVSDGLQANPSFLASIRESAAPSRNGLSNANRTRNAEMAED